MIQFEGLGEIRSKLKRIGALGQKKGIMILKGLEQSLNYFGF
jgi:hypothetical protein